MEIIDQLPYSASSPPHSHQQNGEIEEQVGYMMFKSHSSQAKSRLETTISRARSVSFYDKSVPSRKAEILDGI